MIIRTLAIALASLTIAGCSTVSRDMTFAGAPGQGFAIVVADGMVINGSQSYRFNFQRVDLNTSQFLEDRFWIHFSGMGTIEGNEFRKPQGMETTLRFGGREVPPGDYALVSRTDYASYGTYNSTYVNCFTFGSVVVSVREGAVTVIPGGNVRPSGGGSFAADTAQVEQVLAGYPNIIAPVSPAGVRGVITFSPGRNYLGGQTCDGSGEFAFAPVSGLTEQ